MQHPANNISTYRWNLEAIYGLLRAAAVPQAVYTVCQESIGRVYSGDRLDLVRCEAL